MTEHPRSRQSHFDDLPPAMPPAGLGALLAAVLVGIALAILVLPTWAPALAHTLGGAEPKAFWYLSRASGVVAYVLIWISMMLGLLLSTRLARSAPGGTAVVFDLHQHAALLGVAFALFHALVLLGDRYVGAGTMELLWPFAMPVEGFAWVALGQIALWLSALVAATFYVRQRIGTKTWRAVHFASLTVFVLTLAHAFGAGTDAKLPWLRTLYAVTGASVALGVGVRLVAPAGFSQRRRARR